MARRKTFSEGEPLSLPDETGDMVALSSADEAAPIDDTPLVAVAPQVTPLPATAESVPDSYCDRPLFWNWNL